MKYCHCPIYMADEAWELFVRLGLHSAVPRATLLHFSPLQISLSVHNVM